MKNEHRGGISGCILTSYYNLNLSVCLSVPHLLRRLRADLDQTWQEGWGRVRAEPMVSRHRGAIALLMMAENAIFPSVCAGESQSGNPIGSALVVKIENFQPILTPSLTVT